MIGLAVILAGLGDAVALLHVALGVDHEDGRGDCGGKGGGDGDTGGSHAMLHGTIPVLYQDKRPAYPHATAIVSMPPFHGSLTPPCPKKPEMPCSRPAISCAIRDGPTGAWARSSR